MSSKQPPAKENTTTSNGAVSSNLRSRKTTNATKEKPTAHIDRDLQLSNNNGRSARAGSSTSSSRRSNAKPPPAKKKKEDGMVHLSEDQATVSFPLGLERKERKVVVPKQHATAWQSIIDNSKNPAASLHCLANTHRIKNNGSPPEILYNWCSDPEILSAALLHETSLRTSKTDYGIAVQYLPSLLRTLPLFQSKEWKKATPGEMCNRWHDMVNKFDIDITTSGTRGVAALNIDLDEVAYIYRSSLFVRDNDAEAEVSEMVGSNDNRTAFGRPTCNNPTCTNESVSKGFCDVCIPKTCPFCEKNKAGPYVTFECRSCLGRRHNRVHSGGKLLTKAELKKRGIWNPNPGTLTKELAQKVAKK